jgi:predicted RNA-binding Zn ribbon-like protein
VVAASVAELALVGGHPAIDLVNTVEPRLPVAERHDHLALPQHLLTWAQRAKIVDAAEARSVAAAWASSPASGGRALRAVRDLRDALSEVLSALVSPETGRQISQPELDYLTLGWAAAAGRSRLALISGDRAAARLVVGSVPALLVPDRLAFAAVDLLCNVDLTRLGMCPADADGCGWLFLDHSRNHSRRWCVMDGSCGAQVKARRLTERRQAARAASKNELASSQT